MSDKVTCVKMTNGYGDVLVIPWKDAMSQIEGVLDVCERDPDTGKYPKYTIQVVEYTQQFLDELSYDEVFR
jgi:hypothetical protein